MDESEVDKAVDRLVAEHTAKPENWIELNFKEAGDYFHISFVPEEIKYQDETLGYVGIGTRGFQLDSLDVRDFSKESVAKVKKWASEIVWEFGRG